MVDPSFHQLPGRLAEIDDWEDFLASDPEEIDELRERTRTGRPYGDKTFVAAAESATGRVLRKKQPGRRSRREKLGIMSPDSSSSKSTAERTHYHQQTGGDKGFPQILANRS